MDFSTCYILQGVTLSNNQYLTNYTRYERVLRESKNLDTQRLGYKGYKQVTYSSAMHPSSFVRPWTCLKDISTGAIKPILIESKAKRTNINFFLIGSELRFTFTLKSDRR